MKSKANTFFNFTTLAKRNAKLGAAFDSLDVVSTKDMLADFLRNTRIKTASFERFSDRNHLQGKDGKTIRLKWLSAKGTPIDVLANDFMNQYSYMNLDESEIIQDIVDMIVSYPTGVGAYATARYNELMDEMKEFERMAKSRGVQPDDEDFDYEKFEQELPANLFVKDTDMKTKKKVPGTRKRKMKPVAKKAVKKTATKRRKSKAAKVIISKEFQLIKRLYLLNGKSVKVSQLERLLVELTALLKKGAVSHIQTLNLMKSKLELSIFKLNGFQTESIDKLTLSKVLFGQLENIATKPKIRVTLGNSSPQAGDWKPLFDGGEYTSYRNFFIGKKANKFWYIVNNNIAHKAINLNAAKKAIDSHIAKSGKAPKKKAQKVTSSPTSLCGIETYTLAEAKALGIIDENGKNLAGIEPKAKNPYDVINRILIKQINKGSIPWEIPWSVANGKALKPQNLRSKREYRGVNFWALLGEMDERGHDIPYFLTSKQIIEKGGNLLKGAKPYYVTYYGKFVTTEIEIDRETGESETEEKLIKFLKLYAVYNVADMEGIQYEIPDKKPIKQVERIASAEAIIENMPKRPTLKFGGNEASYSSSTDVVRMPKIESFKQVDRYYSTFFHELIHSTKHDKRCGTDSFRKNAKAHGDKQYSWEELVAELGACYLCGEAGILHKTVGQSAAYAKSWANSLVRYIKDDKTYFFKAANYAQKAADFILNKQAKLSGLEHGSNAHDGVTEDIISIVKEVWPKASVMVIPPKKTMDNNTNSGVPKSNPFTKINQLVSGGTYKLNGDIGEFLGNLGEVDCSMTIKGDQGAGKSQLMWQLIDAFASINKKVAVLSPEMNGNSPTIEKYRNQFISKENQDRVLFTDKKLSAKDIISLAEHFDVVFVDSFNQLEDYKQEQFKEVCSALPNKCIVGIFQSTTSGEMRGGNRPEFDAYVNIEVVKVDDSFVNNYAVCTKNRFGGTGVKYNIHKKKIIKSIALNGVASKKKGAK